MATGTRGFLAKQRASGTDAARAEAEARQLQQGKLDPAEAVQGVKLESPAAARAADAAARAAVKREARRAARRAEDEARVAAKAAVRAAKMG